jgi:hypothetical protein
VQRPLRVPEVARGPALVAVEVPDLQALVDHHGVLDAQALDRRDDVGDGTGGREAARVYADDAQPVAGVALVPGLEVREGAQRVDPAEVPELDQHRASALLVHPQRRDVHPR